MSSKKLIVNADDFGQSPGVNEGIIKAFEDGILTSASLMVRYPAAKPASEYAAKNNLPIGIHLDLGEWRYGNGEWPALYEVVDLENESAVREEILKQLEMFRNLTGKNPTHIDSHQHVHLRENIRPIVAEIAERLNVTLRRCSSTVKYCGDFYGQDKDSTEIHDSIRVPNLMRIISQLQDGITEVACHPGYEIEFDTMYKIEREIEVVSLCDAGIIESIKKNNIELCSFHGINYRFK